MHHVIYLVVPKLPIANSELVLVSSWSLHTIGHKVTWRQHHNFFAQEPSNFTFPNVAADLLLPHCLLAEITPKRRRQAGAVPNLN
jgi:hypothetical protein